ncbi:hypothetical protein MS3_00004260 [Schistosoma haematobium]|uniref:Uncharacterized protein n=1 Tax=Schistosoma haematobium TaxID=6185 RepID=A0A922S3V4_SCHHA|nr:hypothetical protein MS3_00004260 [Schistosoma haematobium]KAH9592279.1 hypothetical protein MS3_00004260 [Schistosoma haematobium]
MHTHNICVMCMFHSLLMFICVDMGVYVCLFMFNNCRSSFYEFVFIPLININAYLLLFFSLFFPSYNKLHELTMFIVYNYQSLNISKLFLSPINHYSFTCFIFCH